MSREIDPMSRECYVVCDECGEKQLEGGVKLKPDSHVPMSIAGYLFDVCRSDFEKIRSALPHVKWFQEYVNQIDGPPVEPLSKGKRK